MSKTFREAVEEILAQAIYHKYRHRFVDAIIKEAIARVPKEKLSVLKFDDEIFVCKGFNDCRAETIKALGDEA